ncbi:MAG TPA: hypothetical protein VM142_12840, partial [Acidimicrobiales bacterium]|nr:hypothetical protein [Acidimicrobiales bacterium]
MAVRVDLDSVVAEAPPAAQQRLGNTPLKSLATLEKDVGTEGSSSSSGWASLRSRGPPGCWPARPR